MRNGALAPKDFIRSLFDKHGRYTTIFSMTYWSHYSTGAGASSVQTIFSRFDSKIPFLNGGLFDPLNDYDWIHTDILLPNELFSNEEKTPECDIGTGILDVFDRYNFTVCEDEPLKRK